MLIITYSCHFHSLNLDFVKKKIHHPIQPPLLLDDLLGLDYLDFTHHSMAILYAPLLVSKQTSIHKHTQGKRFFIISLKKLIKPGNVYMYMQLKL